MSVFIWAILSYSVLHAQDYKDISIWQFDIYFESGQWAIQNTDLLTLDSVSTAMRTDTNYRVNIAAHTDNTGSDIANERLSKKRAEAIQTYLLSKGIDTITENSSEYQLSLQRAQFVYNYLVKSGIAKE